MRWQGQCTQCKTWNSLEETVKDTSKPQPGPILNKIIESNSQEIVEPQRIKTRLTEFDLLLGSGIVPGSVILLGGEPGVGKSTLLLEIARKSDYKIVYVSGEESLGQVMNRAKRLKIDNKNLNIVQENHLATIIDYLEKDPPTLVLIDSIQSVYESSGRGFTGSAAQIRESAQYFLEFAKKTGASVIITGHVTKDGQIAGPKLLEHAVDVVLYFEADHAGYRYIKAAKNRFGSTGEIAVYEMTASGLQEISRERSIIVLEEIGGIGSVLFPQSEGSRILPVEVQVLVSPAGYASGRRIGENVEVPRLHLLAAIAEKYLGLKMSQCDVFVRIRGSAALSDMSADLALLAGIVSSYHELPLKPGLAIAGEVSLTGGIRSPGQLDNRRRSLSSLGVDSALWGGSADKSTLSGDQKFVSLVKDLPGILFPQIKK